MTSLRGFIESWWTELPHATAARWASLFFSLHILTLLISVTATQAFLAAATVAYLTHLLRSRPTISFPPLKLPLLLFCLTTLNSILWAEHPAGGWVAVRKLVLFLILLLSVNLVASARHLGALFRGLFFVSALAGLVGTAQFVIQYHSVRHLHHDRVYYYMTLTRIHGFMGHWMNFGGQQMLVFTALLAFLLLSASLAKGFLAGQEGKGKGLYGLVMAVVATALVLNFTRGVWLGCFVATLYIVARWKPRTLWVIPVLLVVAYLAAPSMIRRRVSLAFHPTDDPALAIRLEMWGAGLRMVREHPWVGVGPENIPQVYTQYLPPGTTPMAGYHDHLHDNLLQLAAERGLPCLVAWLWFMLALGCNILRIRGRLSSERWVADAAFAAWLAFLAEGFFEYNFGTSPVLMVFLFVMSTPFVAEHLESRTRKSSVAGLGNEGR
ncbi:MAG: O-antigen ligase family protein [Terriglobia bacterium]